MAEASPTMLLCPTLNPSTLICRYRRHSLRRRHQPRLSAPAQVQSKAVVVALRSDVAASLAASLSALAVVSMKKEVEMKKMDLVDGDGGSAEGGLVAGGAEVETKEVIQGTVRPARDITEENAQRWSNKHHDAKQLCFRV